MKTEKYRFEKLTPTDSANIEVYNDAIDFVFENPDIHNVAVSGAYSAGKSSLIETYKGEHKDKSFLHLSLAHFTPADQKALEDETVRESVLEGKILNQLLHQIPVSRIPQTNFRVKQETDRTKIMGMTVLTVLYIVSILRIFFQNGFMTFARMLRDGIISNIILGLAQPSLTICAAIFVVLYSGWLIYKVVLLQKNRSIFKRINLNGSEIEIFGNQDESYFDKYLNEVLYLFENSGADVIVFEDMDRFNSSQIFERLHEINRLVNVRRKKVNSDAEPLRFFYLIRDDMFVSKDRTKFFDFIIPVIPVIDSSNSHDKFIECFRKSGYLQKFDMGFLESLSLYVDDMRILKNIHNEFMVYINRLKKIKLDYEKMLAIITYKNLFPRDFSDLQLGKGFVYELFQKKKELAEQNLEELRRTKEKIQSEIQYLDERILESYQELNLIEQDANSRYSCEYYSLSAEERAKRQSYLVRIAERKRKAQELQDSKREQLQQRLEDVEYQIQHTETAPLKDLITRKNVGKLFPDRDEQITEKSPLTYEVKNSDYFDLLKFLIRNGYIDETYPDYMTYFYEDSISAHDKIFLRRITDRLGVDYSYSLIDPEKVAASAVLRDVDFEQEETLNYDLLDYLLGNLKQKKYSRYVDVLIAQIRHSKEFEFISHYYDLDRNRSRFVVKLNEQWNGFFQMAVHTPIFTADQIKKYSIDTLYYSTEDVIQAVNSDSCLCRYISSASEYLVIENPDIEKLVSGFEILSVKFEKLSDGGVDAKLFREVYQRNMYELTEGNITFLLHRVYGIVDDSAIMHKNFTMVTSRMQEPLCQYILKNISDYADIMLEICGDEICDDKDAAERFLNQEAVQTEQRTKYIEKLITHIENLATIKDTDLWPQLMKQNKIEFNVGNMIRFFEIFDLDDILVNYINEMPGSFDFTDVSEVFDESIRKKLYSAVVRCNDISDDKFSCILLGLEVPYQEFDAVRIERSKISIMIKTGILRMDAKTLQYIRNYYTENRYEFIEQNFDEYLDMLTVQSPELEEIEHILSWEIEDDKMLRLLKSVNFNISVMGKSCSDMVTAHILEHHYDDSDFEGLCSNYSRYGVETKKQILKIAIQEQYRICSYEIKMDDGLLSALLTNSNVDRNYKISFFNNMIPNLNEETCKKHLDELDLSELCGIFDRYCSSRKFTNNSETTQILDALKRNSWIYSYHVDEQRKDKYKVLKNRPDKK